MTPPAPSRRMSDPSVVYASGVLAAILLVYAGSLSGGWVWDDHGWAEGPLDWHAMIVGGRALLFRPLAGLGVSAVQLVAPYPWVQRTVSLLLHLGAVGLVAALARENGARPSAAWCGAALFGLHPAAAEVAAWVSCRSEAIPSVLTLGAWLALERRRQWLAGLLLALTPFAKEAWLLAPACVALWMIGRRRHAWGAFVLAALGGVTYLLIRNATGFRFPTEAAGVGLAPAVGGFVARGASLFFVPATADVSFPFVGVPALGYVAMGAGVALIVASWGRPALSAVLLPSPILAADALAGANIGIIADRYYYLGFAGIAVAVAIGAEALMRGPARRFGPLLWGVPALLAWPAHVRAMDFTDDVRLFGAAAALKPDDDRAGVEYASALVRAGDYADAEPLVRRALDDRPEARALLQSCLARRGAFAEVVALGEGATASEVRWNAANALIDLGRPADAEARLRADAAAGPPEARQYVLIGRLALERGAPDEAAAALRAAIALDPTDEAALALLRKVGG